MPPTLPPIDSLRCFVAAAQTLNFRAAARAVALSPAALGQRIQQLEDQLGVPLFDRTTRSVALTGAGLALLPRARDALGSLEACARAARGELGPPPQELVLGTRHELGLSWVLPQLAALRRARPDVTLHLYFGAGEDLLVRLRTHEVDCAVTSTRFADPRLDAVQLHREDYVFVAARKLLARRPLARAEDARHHTLIDAGPELPLFRYWRDAPGGGDRLAFARMLRIGTIAAIERLVLDGEGVAVLPRYLVRAALARGVLVGLFPTVKPQADWFRLVFRADDARRSVFDALATTMRATPLA